MRKMTEKKKIIPSLPQSAKVQWSRSCCCMLEFGFNKKLKIWLENYYFNTPIIRTPIHPSISSFFFLYIFYVLSTIALKNMSIYREKDFSRKIDELHFWVMKNMICFWNEKKNIVYEKKDMELMSLHFFTSKIYNL